MLAYKVAYLTLSVAAGDYTSIRLKFFIDISHHINIALPSEREVLVHDLAYLVLSVAYSSAVSVAFLRLTMKFETPKYSKLHSSSCDRTIIGIRYDFIETVNDFLMVDILGGG